MPDLIGLNGDRAADVTLARLSCVDHVASGGVDHSASVIVRQAPQGGHQVHPGDAIGLEVSR